MRDCHSRFMSQSEWRRLDNRQRFPSLNWQDKIWHGLPPRSASLSLFSTAIPA